MRAKGARPSQSECAVHHIERAQKSADWTYLKATGYMPMVGTICDTGQVVSTGFRRGNTPPAKSNLEFIQQCVQSLPEGVQLNKLQEEHYVRLQRVIDCVRQGLPLPHN